MPKNHVCFPKLKIFFKTKIKFGPRSLISAESLNPQDMTKTHSGWKGRNNGHKSAKFEMRLCLESKKIAYSYSSVLRLRSVNGYAWV